MAHSRASSHEEVGMRRKSLNALEIASLKPSRLSICRNNTTPPSDVISPPWKFTSTERFFTSGKLNDSWVHFVTGNPFPLRSVYN